MEGKPVLEVANLRTEFRTSAGVVRAVDDVSFEAPSSSRDSSPFFRAPARISSRTSSPKVKSGSNQKSESKKDLLRRQLVSSTRAAMNPFG